MPSAEQVCSKLGPLYQSRSASAAYTEPPADCKREVLREKEARENALLEEAKCEFEEAENDTRLHLQRNEVELEITRQRNEELEFSKDALGAKYKDFRADCLILRADLGAAETQLEHLHEERQRTKRQLEVLRRSLQFQILAAKNPEDMGQPEMEHKQQLFSRRRKRKSAQTVHLEPHLSRPSAPPCAAAESVEQQLLLDHASLEAAPTATADYVSIVQTESISTCVQAVQTELETSDVTVWMWSSVCCCCRSGGRNEVELEIPRQRNEELEFSKDALGAKYKDCRAECLILREDLGAAETQLEHLHEERQRTKRQLEALRRSLPLLLICRLLALA
ncbi:paramyosin-like [Drosophila obscura]|uniref:paramyosin-like n=1 Tax=Drosophila obscura TaxID=7282 RepID=UPI001BB2A3B7|nr:paramyosin-like [Drosophila obscura]